jgi:hypothetical protein
MSDTFLTKGEIAELTGRKYVRLQIEALRKMGLPFFNAIGRPVIARSVIEGRREKVEPPKPKWVPNVLREPKQEERP